MTNSKKFICTGLGELDVTLMPEKDGLVMVHRDVLNDIYQQDGMTVSLTR